MSYEYAVYFKLLLMCGYTDELQEYIDKALVEQEPISDIILELSTVNADDNKMLSVLNNYLTEVDDANIDYDTSVFELVLSFLKRKYTGEKMPIADTTCLMNKIAVYTERELEEPWSTMYFMGDLADEAEEGIIDKETFQNNFDSFINDGICFTFSPSPQPEESFFKRLIRKLLKRS